MPTVAPSRTSFNVNATTRDRVIRLARRRSVPVGVITDTLVLEVLAAPPAQFTPAVIVLRARLDISRTIYGELTELLYRQCQRVTAVDGPLATLAERYLAQPNRLVLIRRCPTCDQDKAFGEFLSTHNARPLPVCRACTAANAATATLSVARSALIDCRVCGAAYATHRRCRICDVCLGPGHAYRASSLDPTLDEDCARRHGVRPTAQLGQAVAR